MLKEVQAGLTSDIAEAFAKSQGKIEKASKVASKSGLYGTIADAFAGGIFGPAGKDISEMFGLEDRVEKMFTKTAGHWSRKKRRAGAAGVQGLSATAATGTDALSNKQARTDAALAADANADFMRNSLESNKDVVRELKGIKSGFSVGGMMGSLFKMFLGGGSTIVRVLGAIASGIMGLMGLKSLLPGGMPDIDVDLPGGGDGDIGPDGKPKPKPKPKPKGGRLKNILKGAKGLGGRALSMGGRALPWLGRAGMGLLSSPAAAVAGAGATGYAVGTELNNQFDLSTKLVDGVMAAQSGVSSAWDKAKTFMSGGESVSDILKKAADRTGVDYGILMSVAKQESGFNPNAKAGGKSSAKGLFQFVDKTWAGMVKQYGAAYGIGIGDVMDPLANATMGALYLKDNMRILKNAKVPINGTSLYAAHFMGPYAAAKLFSADPSAEITSVKGIPGLSDPTNSNIYYRDGKKMSQPKTVAEVQQTLFDKVGKSADAFAAHANAQGSSVAPPTVARSKGGDNIPQTIAAPQGSSGPVSSSNTGANGAPAATIDEIPMFVNDMGLVLTTAGAIL